MIFLTVEQVIDFHTEMINEFGGVHGIREMSLLISAVEMPKTVIFGKILHPTVYDKAAAYLFHIISNHPFVDGNKRTGLVSALAFLEINEAMLNYNQNDLEDLVVETGKGKVNKVNIAAFFLKSLD